MAILTELSVAILFCGVLFTGMMILVNYSNAAHRDYDRIRVRELELAYQRHVEFMELLENLDQMIEQA